MIKLLNKLNELYKGENLEKQYLVIENGDGEYYFHWISNDVNEDASNSSFEKYKEAVELYKEKEGVKSYIVHNHPKASPQPSLMDYRNATLLSSWSSILGIAVNDYMVFSVYGYYSFLEAGEWEVPVIRKPQKTYAYDLKLEKFDFKSLLTKKDIIDTVMTKYDEIILINNKLYYSSCLPLEFIKKEVENEGVKIIYFLKQKSESRKMIEIVDCFLKPMTIIEIFPNGQWETIL